MSKPEQIAKLLARRIRNDDYAAGRLPGARKLAAETGVSYMTALQALQKLLKDGLISKRGNGHYSISQTHRRRRSLNIAFITSQNDSDYRLWENAVRSAAENLGSNYRQFAYSHNDDPMITQVIGGDFDLVFIKHPIVGYPFVEKLVIKHCHKVVTLFNNMTEHGVRCFDGPPPAEVRQLVDHLYLLGHRRFASYTLSPFTSSAREKIAVWNSAVAAMGIDSVEVNIETPPELHLMDATYKYTAEVLRARPCPTALFCSSVDIAIGAIRYCHDHNVKVGDELAVCSLGKPELARMYIPSITTIDRPSPVTEAEAIIADLLQNGADKPSRLMFRPETGRLLIGESTDPGNSCKPQSLINNQQLQGETK